MKNKMEIALEAFNSQEFDECEKICLSLLNEGDANVVILNLLGIINSNKANANAALSYFEMGKKRFKKSYFLF